MKNSGIEWIGNIPSEWEITPFRAYVKERKEKNKSNKTTELLALSYALGVTLYRDKVYNKDRVKENFEEYSIVHKNDLVLSPNDIIKGSIFVSRYDGCISPMYHIFEARYSKTHNLNYLSYLLRTKEAGLQFFYIARGLIGAILDNGKYVTRRMTVSKQDLLTFKVLLPPYQEQEKIVDFLDSKCSEIDALSADIQSEIDSLEAYKRSVITEAVTKGLDRNIQLKDSGIEWLGKVPYHWKLIRGKYCLKYLQKSVKDDDGVITCFRDGEVTLRSNRREDGFTVSDKEIGYQGIDVGDLVVHGMDGFAGAIGISDSRGKASPVLNVLDTDSNKKYIMYYLRSMAYGDVFIALSTGIRVRSCDLRWNKLAELIYPIPPRREQDEIVSYIDDKLEQADGIIREKKEQLEILIEYKKSVIYEYATGKKEVPNN